jgi:hypothetical protein
VLLDTHVLPWLADDRKLGKTARRQGTNHLEGFKDDNSS